MLIKKKQKKLIDIETYRGVYSFRFTNFFDSRSRELEEKIRQNASSVHSIVDDSGVRRELTWPHLSFWQSYHYLDQLNNETAPFYLLQMSNSENKCYYQVVIQSEVSKISLFQVGTLKKWIPTTDPKSLQDQEQLIKELISFCISYTNLMTLRMEPYLPGKECIEKTYNMLFSLGFCDVSPKSYIKTRMLDLRPTVDEMLSFFSANGRARLKIKTKDLNEVEIKEINDVATIPFLQDALDSSFLRSINKHCPYNFHPLFSSMKKFSREITMLGFYLLDGLPRPMAFITGIKHGSIVEFSVGGSLSDTQLRKFPFNHLLMWQLALLAKKNGSLFLDMGGIASDPENNPLSGITNFKRFFPGFEMSIGREMLLVLHPNYLSFYSMIQSVTKWFR